MVVVSRNTGRKGGTHWYCICDCGRELSVESHALGSGKTKSCGCRRVVVGKLKKRHGKSHTKIHNTWMDMKKRCFNKNSTGYEWYGGRGITVCGRWMKFENFYADMGDPAEGMSLDRIDYNGNYEPGNCRWATDEQQMNNTSKNRFIEMDGKRQTISQWAREIGIGVGTISWRLRHGIKPVGALSATYLEHRPEKIGKRNRVLSLNGKAQTMSQWSRETGIKIGTIWMRLKMGWSIERTLTNA